MFWSVSNLPALASPTPTLPNATGIGEIVMGVVPVPVNAREFAFAIGLLTTLNFHAALRTPPRVGWNVSVTVQVAAGASVGPHVVAD